MLGVFDRDNYYPYHPGIDENEFGIGFTKISYAELQDYFRLLDKIAASIIYRPWIYALLGLLVVAVATIRFFKQHGHGPRNVLAATVSFSGLSSAGSLLIIATAADYRYMTWTILSALLATVTLVGDIYQTYRTAALTLRK